MLIAEEIYGDIGLGILTIFFQLIILFLRRIENLSYFVII
jgi:hypothetical protein